jgi:CheY-like chemotaxis protein
MPLLFSKFSDARQLTKKVRLIAGGFFSWVLGCLLLNVFLAFAAAHVVAAPASLPSLSLPRLTLPTDQSTDAIDLASYWQVFDGDIKDQLELALQPNTPLTSHTPKRLTLSAKKHDLWLRLNLHSAQATDQWFLQVGPGALSRITLYFYDQHQQSNLQTNGRVYPQQQAVTQLQYSGGYLLPLPLRRGDQSVLLNIHHTATTNVTLQLISQTGLAAQRPSQQHWSGVWTGILLGLVLLQIYLGWQQKFRAFYGLALANLGWSLAWIIEQKIGLTSIQLAIFSRTPVLSHVLMGLSWTLYLHFMRQALDIEIYFPRWHRIFLATLALVFISSLLLPIWSGLMNSELGLSLLISASGGMVILACWFCRQATLMMRVLVVLCCVSIMLGVNLDLLMSLLPHSLILPWPHHWIHLGALIITLLISHAFIQFEQWQQQHSEQSFQQKNQRQLALQLRQVEWHNRLHHQCLQQIQTAVGQLIASLSSNPTQELSPTLNRVHHALQRVQDLAADGPVQDMPFLLKPLLMQLAKECLESCKTKNLKFHVAFDKKLPQAVRGDARLLHRLLHELLRNAVHYTEKGDVIFKVSTTTVPAPQDRDAIYRIDFLIQDTGSGLPEAHETPAFKMKKIPAFSAQAFSAAPATDASAEGSLAMGLVICRHLVQLLQGSLQIKAISGQGSRFMVRLNLPATDPSRASADPLNGNIMPLRVHAKAGVELALVVDDNRSIQQSLSATLKKLGYKCFIASSGTTAIDILALNAIDIIFMDCEMPEMNGFETLQALRAMPHHQRVPVIAISSYAHAEFHAKAIAGGFNDYIEKPITREKIRECLLKLHLEIPSPEEQTIQ